MKTFIQSMLFLLATNTSYGQDLAGQWDGSLRVQGKDLRIIFHVNKVNGQYESTFDSPDQNASGIKVDVTRFEHPKVTFKILSGGANFEGIISEAGITGKWEQSGTSLFLFLSKHGATDNEQK